MWYGPISVGGGRFAYCQQSAFLRKLYCLSAAGRGRFPLYIYACPRDLGTAWALS